MYFSNEVINDHPRYHILSNGTLRIQNTLISDAGFYECMAKNKMGEARSRKASMLMHKKPPSENEISNHIITYSENEINNYPSTFNYICN